MPPEAQEAFATRIGAHLVRIDASHSPFLSRPEEIADAIEAAASSAPTEAISIASSSRDDSSTAAHDGGH